LLFGCTFEDDQAMQQYKKAKQSREIVAQIDALKALVLIDPRKYRMELLQAKAALESLNKAQQLQTDKQFYQSYLLAHDAYRNFPNKEAKLVLASTGKYFIALLKVENLVKKSFKLLPPDLLIRLAHYKKQPVDEWNLAQLNELLISLSKSSQELTRGVTLLEQANINTDLAPVEIIEWQHQVKQLRKQVRQLKGYLISMALTASASELLLLNKNLTEEAAELLAYVKPEIAMNGLQPKFNEAFLRFNPYSELIKNISLSVSSSGLSADVQWYKEWYALEKQTLMLEGDFSDYVKLSPTRMISLKKMMIKQGTKMPDITEQLSLKALFIGHNSASKVFIEKLAQDKSLL
jgi:hypothetical protein